MSPARAQAFEIAVPDTSIDDLQRRLRATRLPAGDLGNADWNYGVGRSYMSGLLADWADHFDWRAHEREMNRYPHLRVEVDGQVIHYLHLARPGRLPLLLVGGWPQTFWDFRDVLPELDDFELIVPDLPGQGFSTPLSRTGIGFTETAEMFYRLMVEDLGHQRFGVYGTDWGALIGEYLCVAHPEAIIGLHSTMPIPLDFSPNNRARDVWAPDEAQRREAAHAQSASGSGYLLMQIHRPQTIAYLTDSPSATAAWLIDKVHAWADHDGDVEDAYPREQLLILLSVFWFTGTIGSAARFYAESFRSPWRPSTDMQPMIAVPTAVAAYPRESGAYPKAWIEQYFDLRRYTVMARGGHFPAVEDPHGLGADIAQFFSGLSRTEAKPRMDAAVQYRQGYGDRSHDGH